MPSRLRLSAPSRGRSRLGVCCPIERARVGADWYRDMPATWWAYTHSDLRADSRRELRVPWLSTASVRRQLWRRISGHHAGQDHAVLSAVNASVLRTDRDRHVARLRALTAPARSAVCWQLRDGRSWYGLTSWYG